MADQATPYFSVIVPVHNREQFIGSMISSVLAQQFHNFELVIVNDGSTDNTENEIKTFSDPRIKYIGIENRERAGARNAGASAAIGQYFNFFDSDDLMYPHHLQTAFEFVEKRNSPSWFHVGYEIADESGKIFVRENGMKQNPEEKLIATNYLGCNSVFTQRDFFLENRFNEDRRLSSSEDWELWLRLISRKDLLVCESTTFRMTHHATRSLLTISPDRIIERDTLMFHYLMNDKPFVAKFSKNLSLFEADRYTFFALTLVVAKRRIEAWAYLKKSFTTSSAVLSRKRFWACIKLLLISLVK